MKQMWIGITIGVLLVAALFMAPINRYFENRIDYVTQKVDDTTNYDTLKKVEDTCRAMIASYESDRLTYEQYKESDSNEKQNWAEQAKMRANKTAASYNSYILENSFVWRDNVPDDIDEKLEYLE